jgi:hypothetical protein
LLRFSQHSGSGVESHSDSDDDSDTSISVDFSNSDSDVDPDPDSDHDDGIPLKKRLDLKVHSRVLDGKSVSITISLFFFSTFFVAFSSLINFRIEDAFTFQFNFSCYFFL